MALAEIGTTSQANITRLRSLMSDESDRVRVASLKALANSRIDDDLFMPIIRTALQDSDDEVQDAGFTALLKVSRRSDSALPMLREDRPLPSPHRQRLLKHGQNGPYAQPESAAVRLTAQ